MEFGHQFDQDKSLARANLGGFIWDNAAMFGAGAGGFKVGQGAYGLAAAKLGGADLTGKSVLDSIKTGDMAPALALE